MNERHIELVMPAGHVLMVHAYGTGKPLVLLHGFPLDARLWLPCRDKLVAAGYQLLAPDLRGFGKSSPLTAAITIADLAHDIEQMRQILMGDDPIALAGLSLGGYVALEYWRQYGRHLQALILSNTKPQADSTEARQARIAMADKALSESTWDAVSPMLAKLLSPRTIEHDAATTETVRTMMSSVPSTTIAQIQHAMAKRHDFTEELKSVRIPTLVITGEDDAISPPNENRKWAAAIPGSRLEVLAGAAHLPPLECPTNFSDAILNFL